MGRNFGKMEECTYALKIVTVNLQANVLLEGLGVDWVDIRIDLKEIGVSARNYFDY